MNQKMNKKSLLGLGVLVAIIVVFVAIYCMFGAKGVAGEKNITIEVINKLQESTVYQVNTDAEFLREAMNEAKRCLDCPSPSCMTGCPVEINIPKFIKNIERGEILDSTQIGAQC